VIAKLRLGVETGAGIVQIHVILLIEAPVLARAQSIQSVGGGVARIGRLKSCEVGLQGDSP